MQIKILKSAENDIMRGFYFYEKQKIGLGEYFINSIFSDIESLHIFGGVHKKVFGFYKMISKRFPFAIYYKIKDKNIIIFAVLDCRQNPVQISKRLRSDNESKKD